MALFVDDTFTEGSDVNLSAHTGETGASWTVHGSYAGNVRVAASVDKIMSTATGTATSGYYASGAPAGVEYDVESDIEHNNSTNDNTRPGMTGRMSTSANTMYHIRWERSGSLWQLYKFVGGTATLLATYSDTFSTGTTKAVRLEIKDATKKVFIDTVERISSTDNVITAAGKAGVRWTHGAAGQHGYRLDNFQATDIITGPTIISRTLSESIDANEPNVLRETFLRRSIAEALSINDSAEREVFLLRSLLDTMEANDFIVSDIITGQVVITRALLSSIDASDSLSRELKLFRTLLTSFDLNDFTIADIVTSGIVIRTLSESLDIVDAITATVIQAFDGFLKDTFTETIDTDLDSHTGEVGAAWTDYGPPGTDKLMVSAATDTLVRKTPSDITTATSQYESSGTADTDDYYVTFDLEITTGSIYAGIVNIYGKATTTEFANVRLTYSVSAGTWSLWDDKNVVEHDVYADTGPMAGVPVSMKIEFGIDKQFVYREGVLIMTGYIPDLSGIAFNSIMIDAIGADSGFDFALDNLKAYDNSNLIRFITDNFEITDSFVAELGVAALFKVLSDSINITDTTLREFLLDRVLINILSISDDVLPSIQTSRLLSDLVDLSDSLSDFKVMARSILDAITLSDISSRTLIAGRALLESISANDSIDAITSKVRVLLDTLDLSESVLATISPARIATLILSMIEDMYAIESKILPTNLTVTDIDENIIIDTEIK